MSLEGALVKFVAKEDQKIYFASFELYSASLSTEKNLAPKPPAIGTVLQGYSTFEDLFAKGSSKPVTVQRLLAPLPHIDVPIYCVGLNYKSHAEEAKLGISKYAPLWTKPAASLANPDEAIPVNKFCATSLLDFEGELVFVTSKAAKDITPQQAESHILGYTVGNDLSCRFFQLPNNSGGQYYFAKAFDKFAPLGPVLVSPKDFDAGASTRRLTTKVNGNIVQDTLIADDMVFSPAQILSQMSQGTTIPAGTAVMTGTPAGVGAFQSPKSWLGDGDEIEVELSGVGTLRNTVRFEE